MLQAWFDFILNETCTRLNYANWKLFISLGTVFHVDILTGEIWLTIVAYRYILDSYPCSQMQYVVLCTWNVWFCFWINRALKLPLKLKLYFWYQIVKNSIIIERKQPQKIQLKVKLKSAHRNEIFLQKPQPFDGFWYLRWGKKCR